MIQNRIALLLPLAALVCVACDDPKANGADANTDIAGAGGAILCVVQDDCPMGYLCEGGVCSEWTAAATGACFSSADCPDGQQCEIATGRCLTPVAPPTTSTLPPAEEPLACILGEVRTCGVSKIGACTFGTEACINGAWTGVCVGNVNPRDEECNGRDDDCNGLVDDGDVGEGAQCSTSLVGACAIGHTACLAGQLTCDPDVDPLAETCDAVDNDCDGEIDNGNPGGGDTCNAGGLGECEAGHTVCDFGIFLCTADSTPTPESCDAKDNDCDGATDENNPGGGGACSTGLLGVCGTGAQACRNGAYDCDQTNFPSTETCNGQDDNCDGSTDEGVVGAGSCDTGIPGVCAVGESTCGAGGFSCVQTVFPSSEICDGKDNDCDGKVDEGFDADSDGYPSCNDCNDNDPTMNPGRAEVCDQKDNDCDGVVDDGLQAPIADASSDLTVGPPTMVRLDGTRSRPLVGTSLFYQWRIVSQPTGITATISNPTSATPSFFASGAGDYVIELQVTDATGCRSTVDQVIVHALPSDDIHIELTWDTNKTDMDLHYLAPTGSIFSGPYTAAKGQSGCGYAVTYGGDCCWQNLTPDWGGANNPWSWDCNPNNDPSLDLDDVDGLGPENVNQSNPFDGTYKINVHYYCYRELMLLNGKRSSYGTVVGPSTAHIKIWVRGAIGYEDTQLLKNRENWEAAKLTILNGRVSFVGADTDRVSKLTSGCAD